LFLLLRAQVYFLIALQCGEEEVRVLIVRTIFIETKVIDKWVKK